ncbi:MAG: hypothetical protein J0L93_10645 [Deltaproteobacteria bacterium]|nr:hypothetical protein [Deltaproteobacteria bacterium]
MFKFAGMEEEVKVGIENFRKECEKRWAGIQLVIPVRPTGGNFLISFTLMGFRTYGTVHEDDFADFGEFGKLTPGLEKVLLDTDQKLKSAHPADK